MNGGLAIKLRDRMTIIANCATHPHDPASRKAGQRLDPFTKDIPYDWSLKHG
jgi:hypothetical protein